MELGQISTCLNNMRYKKFTPRREQGVVCLTFLLSVVITTNILSSIEHLQPEAHVNDDTDSDDPGLDESVWARDPHSGRLVLKYFGQGHQGYRRSLMEKEEMAYNTNHVISDTLLIGEDLAEPGTYREKEKEVEAVYDPKGSINSSEMWKHCLTINPKGRLGNKLFAYAALLGIAKNNYMWPCYHGDDEMQNIFNLKAMNFSSDLSMTPVQYVEKSSYVYEKDTKNLNYSLDIELVGYFHSYKYFKNITPLIREEFSFKESVVTIAKKFLHYVLDKVQRKTGSKRVVPIGIHVRLGDMQDYYNVEKGYTVVSLDYIDTAMTYFLATYGPEGLVFIVCSDDILDTRGKLTGLKITSQVPTFYADDMAFLLELAEYNPVPHLHEAAVQLCLLSLCKHNIISTGSFSWWSGWLSNGTVIYYKNFPKPFSQLDREFESQDYFPKNWIGFD